MLRSVTMQIGAIQCPMLRIFMIIFQKLSEIERLGVKNLGWFQIELILSLAKKLSGLLGSATSMLLNKILKMMMEHMGTHWTPSALISANPPQQANFLQIIYRFLVILIIFLTSRLN